MQRIIIAWIRRININKQKRNIILEARIKTGTQIVIQPYRNNKSYKRTLLKGGKA